MNSSKLQIVRVTLAIALLASMIGCSEKQTANAPVAPKIADLGEVELMDKTAHRHEFGNGRTAVLTPTAQSDGTIEVQVMIEDRNAATVQPIAMPRVRTLPNRPVEISVGEIGVRFTPRLKRN